MPVEAVRITNPLPQQYLTTEPGLGGVIKQRPDDFLVEELPLYEVEANGAVITVALDRGMSAGRWTTITYKASGTGTRLTYLPGDVDNDGLISFQDMLVLLGRSGETSALPLYRIDIDRNGVSALPDALRLIDLFAEPGAYRAALPTGTKSRTGASP